MNKDEIRKQMTEVCESVIILEAQTRITTDMAKLGIIPKAEAIKNIENALVEVRALRERHTSLRQQYENLS